MKKEKNLVIAMITISLIIFVLLFLTFCLCLGSQNYYNSGINYKAAYNSFITFLSLFGVFSIAFGIVTLAKDWKNEYLNSASCKVLWGVFSFLLLGLIAVFIFGIIAMNQYKKTNWKPQTNNNNISNQYIENSNNKSKEFEKYEALSKLHNLHQAGAINTAEYEKEKRKLLD